MTLPMESGNHFLWYVCNTLLLMRWHNEANENEKHLFHHRLRDYLLKDESTCNTACKTILVAVKEEETKKLKKLPSNILFYKIFPNDRCETSLLQDRHKIIILKLILFSYYEWFLFTIYFFFAIYFFICPFYLLSIFITAARYYTRWHLSLPFLFLSTLIFLAISLSSPFNLSPFLPSIFFFNTATH